MRFSDIIGHDKLKQQLIKLSNEGRVSHAVLFCEEPGYGALALALAFAQYNSCPHKNGEDSCGTCPTCNKFQKMIHPDLHFAVPVSATKKITADKKPVTDMFIDEWRKVVSANPEISEQEWYDTIGIENKQGIIGVNEAGQILKKLNFRAFEGGDKYMIIWLPERMNQEAANKLLKLIEEPPAGTYIFMVTQAPERIITTILSRCQIVRVMPIEQDVLARHLEEESGLTAEDALLWSRISSGSLSRAREMICSDKEAGEDHEILIKLLDACSSKDMTRVIQVWERVATFNREKQKDFCYYALEFLRELYITSLGLNEIANIPLQRRDVVATWVKKIKPTFYQKSYDVLNNALKDIERNVNSKYIFADVSNRFFLSL
ncbi:MAG: DNA polymerase III subunit delta' [Bacteroidia bacterium]|nr:DNA polymerase III subunit delta' [Bacteroidia bacterium]